VRYRRDVFSVNAAAFAIRKALFEQIGGLDEREDVCARARAAGARTVVQPAASVVCSIETASSPTAIAPTTRRALVIDDWTPRPDRDAGSNVALQHMLSLQRLGYHVIFAASQSLEDAPGYTPALERLGVEGVYAPFYASIEDALARLAPLDLVYLHRFSNADAYLDACRRLAPKAAVLYNVADLHALRQARAAALGLESGAAVDAAREFSRLVEADAGLVHSSHEAALVRAAAPAANVHCVTWPVAAAATPAPYAARRDIGFLGSFGHAPNADAMRFYARDILRAFDREPPLLRMAGSGMTEEMRALANADIRAEGQIGDLDGFLSSLRATVAPLRFGAGLKGKVLDSLARGTPCVMTSSAAEGLDLPEVLRVCVVDDPRGIAARLLQVIDDEALWARLSQAGLAYIRERYSRQRIDEELAAAIVSARMRRANGE
jgi:glycosyltransferase involved in cell wall biosynthesis